MTKHQALLKNMRNVVPIVVLIISTTFVHTIVCIATVPPDGLGGGGL